MTAGSSTFAGVVSRSDSPPHDYVYLPRGRPLRRGIAQQHGDAKLLVLLEAVA